MMGDRMEPSSVQRHLWNLPNLDDSRRFVWSDKAFRHLVPHFDGTCGYQDQHTVDRASPATVSYNSLTAAPPLRGAYGLALTGVPELDHRLVAARPSWPELRLELRVAVKQLARRETIDPRSAILHGAGGTSLEIDRERGLAVITSPEPLAVEALAHPHLSTLAVVNAYWNGWESLHGGAVAGENGAWGIVGARGAGKSSLIAALADIGLPVVCDDMLVIRERLAFAGPRCVDLRRDAAEALGVGEPLGLIGTRERWRFHPGSVASELPLRQLVFLEWGDTLELDSINASDRLRRLLPQRGIRLVPPDPGALLDLAALPGLLLRRPRALAALPESAELLLRAS